MKNTWKYIVGILGIAGLLYYGSSALEVLNAPSFPAVTEQFKLHYDRIDAIVDEHWNRDGAIPTASDLRAYYDLIEELNKVDYVPVKQAHDRSLTMQDPARELWLQRATAYLTTYYRLAPYLGEGASLVLTEIAHRPALDAADYCHAQVQKVRMVSSKILSLRPNTRYHLAMALILGGDDKGAIEQVKMLLKEDPDYVHSGIPYVIGLRAHADDDPDYLSALEAAGANPITHRSQFATFGTVKFSASFGNTRHGQH